MGKAARAIIVDNGKLLLMHRNKHGSEYFTLVGGRLQEDETPEQAVKREVKEETGLEITDARLVFTEDYEEPYNFQYIYLCQIAPHADIAVTEESEEGFMNKMGMNIHSPKWMEISALPRLQFRTPALHSALIEGLRHGFPDTPKKLS